MNSNDCIKMVHNALIDKLAERCAVDGNARYAIEIGRDLAAYGQRIAAAFADDGKISDVEKEDICAQFAEKVVPHIPAVDNSGVSIAWNGFTFFGLGWKGLKYHLNKLFDLGV